MALYKFHIIIIIKPQATDSPKFWAPLRIAAVNQLFSSNQKNRSVTKQSHKFH